MQRLIVYDGGRERPAKTSLLDVLVRSDEVTLIGITHHKLPEALKQALEMRSTFWRRIDIVYPNVNNVRRLIDDGHIPSMRLDEWESSRENVQHILEGEKAARYSRQWSCVECMQSLSFTGSRTVYGRQSNIRFIPLLSGMDPRSLSAVNISPNTALFAQVSQAIDLTLRNSAGILEWDLIGLAHEDSTVFRYYGIMPRINIASSDAPRNAVFPIVITLPYVRSLDGTHVVLQERTPFNAVSDVGKLSTFSSRICTEDMVNLHPGRFWLSFDASNLVATNAFNAMSGLFEGAVLDSIVWRRAAARALREELGLDITPSRLEEWQQLTLVRNGKRQFFQIFALELRQDMLVDELALVTQRRPKATVNKYRLSELQLLHEQNRLNHVLQTEFERIFLPLFKQINVVP